MGDYGIGQPVRRKEDAPLLTGKGRFTDDLDLDGQAYAHFLRSPHAHARIQSIDLTAARAAPGVIAALAGGDLNGIGPIYCECELTNRDGSAMFNPIRSVLPTERVRFVGEPVALVVAATAEAARDACELIEVEYDALAPAASTARALDVSAPVVWPELGSNLCVTWQNRDPEPVETLLANAHKVVRIDVVNNRLVPSPMEPRVALATCDRTTGKMTLYAPTQGGRRLQNLLASSVFNVAPEMIRVISNDSGGGFGVRSRAYPELAALLWAARDLDRPLKWRGDRSETFVSDYHGRDQVSHAEMGLNKRGRVIALKIETIVNLGAYVTEMGPRVPMLSGGRIIPCAYDIENFYFSVKPVFTNTVPTDTYRGAGAPEANLLMERLMDEAAHSFGLTRHEIRRRNLIPSAKLPYRTQMGVTIDSGDFVGTMDMAMKAADWDGFAARRRKSKARGRLRGIGLCVFLESAGARPFEEMRIRVEADGGATIFAGTYSHGQGHATVWSQLLTDFLGVPFDNIALIQGDTDLMPKRALGTFGSRSSMLGGVALKRACERIIDKGKAVAAHLMQTDRDKVDFRGGVFHAATSSVSLAEVAVAAQDPDRLPDGIMPGLDESYFLDKADLNFPNGCHICEIEIDPDTGAIEILAFTAVDDCGVVLNPLIVHGQLDGALAQGIGQALFENVTYDQTSGQLLTGSYMDYGMPRADHLSNLVALFKEVPCRTNDLGVKGAGEGGTCGAPPAVVSAVLDALKPYKVRHLDMPLTAEKVWQAIRTADSAAKESQCSHHATGPHPT